MCENCPTGLERIKSLQEFIDIGVYACCKTGNLRYQLQTLP